MSSVRPMSVIIGRVKSLFSYVHSTANSIRNRLPLKVLIPILLISLIAITSFAATVGVTTTTYSGEGGVSFIVIGCFTATSNGFQVVRSTTAATSLPATWSNGTTVNTLLTAGD
jgi:hypothetical protein